MRLVKLLFLPKRETLNMPCFCKYIFQAGYAPKYFFCKQLILSPLSEIPFFSCSHLEIFIAMLQCFLFYN